MNHNLSICGENNPPKTHKPIKQHTLLLEIVFVIEYKYNCKSSKYIVFSNVYNVLHVSMEKMHFSHECS